MLFSSTVFLFLFLPVVLVVYYILPRTFKNTWLLGASLAFYAWGEPEFLPIMLFSIAINYVFAIIVDKKRESKTAVRWILAVAVISNLMLLGYFKYAGFIVENMNSLFGTDYANPNVPLPLGISFYTFQAISYVIDVYRRDGGVQKNPINMALYKSLFPQLIAGPIVRYQTVSDQIKDRKETFEKFAYGTKRFIIGLGKKMFLANNCGWVADQVFAQNPDEISMGLAWIGIIAYSLQIYFDFSGYSDMAIGLGKMFGFDFLENFNYPYISRSVAEFWRRWHISLGTWFRDYLYIPLGGSRVSEWKVYRNLAAVWFATGIWHGASWTFIAWGVYYGVFIMLERAFLGKLLKKWPVFVQHIYALLVVIAGWVFFRAETFTYAIGYYKAMLGLNGAGIWSADAGYYFTQYGILILLAIIGATPLLVTINKSVLDKRPTLYTQAAWDIGKTGYYLLVMAIGIVSVVANTFNPFIYFRF
ncbi:MBOAT family O-acyltransferase [Peribacillus sp. SCS-26]|uniref:MBOAT family O-acyltransferase n=1 Tax=Paraperibacillus marinus TaxID=3115295 RepID=UPI003905CD2F